jgi:hypothetical protein
VGQAAASEVNPGGRSFLESPLQSLDIPQMELEGKLVKLASEEAKNSRWWSDRCTALSYFLYFTGWILAVVGKALNVRGMELPSPES